MYIRIVFVLLYLHLSYHVDVRMYHTKCSSRFSSHSHCACYVLITCVHCCIHGLERNRTYWYFCYVLLYIQWNEETRSNLLILGGERVPQYSVVNGTMTAITYGQCTLFSIFKFPQGHSTSVLLQPSYYS